METLVLDCHLVFDLSDLDLDDLVSFLYLEVSYLGYEGLDLLPNLLDEFAPLHRVHLLRTLSCHQRLHLLGHHGVHLLCSHFITSWASRGYGRIASQWAHRLAIWEHEALLSVGGRDNFPCLRTRWGIHDVLASRQQGVHVHGLERSPCPPGSSSLSEASAFHN